MRRVTITLLAALLCAAAPCGTVVIPNNVGLGAPGPVTSLNPLIGSSATNFQLDILLFRPLVWIGQDGRMDRARSLAEAIVPLDGGRRIRVVLQRWAWSDGVALAPDDVVFTWQCIQRLGELYQFAGQGGVPGRVADVRAVDGRTVDFLMRGPVNADWFVLNALSVFTPLPRRVWGDIGRDAMWQRQTDLELARVVDGPFRLAELRLDRYAALTPNTGYGGPPAHVARLVVDFLEGANVLAALRAGALDMAELPEALAGRMRAIAGFDVVALPEPFSFLEVIFSFDNKSVAFLRDARVRRALSDAADQERMVALVYHGRSHVNRVPVPVDPPVWLSPAALAGTLPVRSDKALARAELEAAGWQPGADGIRTRDGARLAFTIEASADTPERAQLLQVWQQDLRAVGVALAIRTTSLPALLATLNGPAGGWEAMLLTEAPGGGMPDGSGHFDTGGGDGGGYTDARMDALIRASVDQPGMAAFIAYEDYAAEQQPVVVLPQGAPVLAVSRRLSGVERATSPFGYWAPEELWVRDEGCAANARDTRH